MEPTAVKSIATINGLYQQQLSAQKSAKQVGAGSPQAANDASSPVDSVKVRTSVTMKNLDTVRAIEQMHARLNQLAKGVRETNESVNKATEQIDAMKNSLQVVFKNFPPFPVDSKERNDTLMQYSSLRKELLSLMVPPPPPAPYEKVKHLWDSLFDEKGSILPKTVPELENNSSDAQLKNATLVLDSTSMQLADLSNKVTQALVQP